MPFNFDRDKKRLKDIYDDFEKEKLIVDHTYQRRKVWLPQDKVRLIETILMGLIIPEVFFWPAETDPVTGDRVTHIVDGQQRIVSILEFINNDFKLTEKHLLDKEIKEAYGGKDWYHLPDEAKDKIWDYKLLVVEIDRQFSKEDIKKMFYRLNLTNYSLNNQEKRKSKESVFGEFAEALARQDFWSDYKVFSAADARRMLDVQYCCSLYILAKEGLIDQTSDKVINDYYDDYKNSFDDDKKLTDKILFSMDIIRKLADNSTLSFASKKAQMFTIFSLVFKMIDNNIDFNQDIFEKFKLFVIAYNDFKNEYEFEFKDVLTRDVYENIKKYKLASSEGVNKLGNRVIRLEVLSRFILESKPEIKQVFRQISEEIKNVRTNLDNQYEELENKDN